MERGGEKDGSFIFPKDIMFYYELHLHTAETSRCGRSPAADMVKVYCEKGFSGIVITDHFINGNSYANDPAVWDEKMDVYLRGYNAAKTAGEKYGLPVYFGIEYTHLGGNGEDYLLLGLKPEYLYAELRDCDKWSIEYLCDTVHALGGIVIRAHPYREAGYIRHPGIERPGLDIDAIEVFNTGNASDEYNRKALELAMQEGKPWTAGSDTHHVDTTATAYVGFEEKPKDYAELCQFIRDGKAYVIYRPKKAVQ
ncbi:MAG: PHP-associated domain-containing protein [Clostridia bacterium]|nr:PHP-associated domain-containing protein [Clostridia bacterium]